jgi:hypothetical protein
MTAIEATTQPPANYPAADWTDDPEDYFYVPSHLRGYYADQKAAPNARQIERLYENLPFVGGGRVQVDRIVTDASGRHVKADPILLGNAESRGLLGNLRAAMVVVDPHAGTQSLPYRTWEHDARLEHATRKHSAAEAILSMQQSWPRCTVCGVTRPGPDICVHYGPFTKARTLCLACAEAVNTAGALRHLAAHQDRIDTLLGQQKD